ncbi:hypothetical protein AN4657.2 [Aspergillus nidulans FGSC A4]|uniref:HNH nuclease domain-containing protein n=1 Tax=Emericella nidulans (strain FGSC A4 / ATCC 38163 / CBS 112.46 / NRRL 194 / M139) TaxID=227321 RepID=Q5B473_EMENI|nr:hypothetical protein [Aspergillus nidulans FGSC A4]EAA60459.1 hypothetical protein AN4657.2 [Aspergillus nidulans FGSC A4]CBF77053.1 TPA: conserved hypothetical protein [Aspergillus nidulans FGSC A4]|eukprot:XP_662261.1 hypothetical protein AN4657.2 [Aspergillus nidulans FGSC A4]
MQRCLMLAGKQPAYPVSNNNGPSTSNSAAPSSLEGVIVPSSQPLPPEERDLAIRIFDEITLHFERSQETDSGYKPITLIRLMKHEVSETDEFLSFFFSFTGQDLLDEEDGGIGLDRILLHLAGFSNWSTEEQGTLSESLVTFAKYLVDNFFLPLKALAAKTPQPTPASSRSKLHELAIGTPQRVSNLRKDCLRRDRHRCVISRKFYAQEAQNRYKRDGRDVKDDDGKSLLPERDIMAYLEVAHIMPHSLRSITSGGSEGRLLFGNFEIAFEPVDSQPHTYRINYIDSDRMGRVEKLPVTVSLFITPNRDVEPPSPELLRIHGAIGRILHLSAAGEYIDEFIRDLEEMESGEVMQNGTTRLDDYVRFRVSYS